MALSYILPFLFIASAFACSSPELSTTSFTTQDATIVAHIAYIGEFSIKCASGTAGNLYAEIQGAVVPVAVVGPNRYQISWTEDTKTARSGERLVRVFDEEGYSTLRKASRSGEDTTVIPSFIDVPVHHPGAFNGPWLDSEFLAAKLAVVVAYIAISSHSKIVA